MGVCFVQRFDRDAGINIATRRIEFGGEYTAKRAATEFLIDEWGFTPGFTWRKEHLAGADKVSCYRLFRGDSKGDTTMIVGREFDHAEDSAD